MRRCQMQIAAASQYPLIWGGGGVQTLSHHYGFIIISEDRTTTRLSQGQMSKNKLFGLK
jgi:hypothetical protein